MIIVSSKIIFVTSHDDVVINISESNLITYSEYYKSDSYKELSYICLR